MTAALLAASSFARARDWMLDLDGDTQRAVWWAVLLAVGWLVGSVFARALRFFARRVEGGRNEDRWIISAMASLARVLTLLAAAAVAADITAVFDIERSLAVAVYAARALAIIVAGWFIAAWIAKRIMTFGARPELRDNNTLFAFLAGVVRWGAMAVVVIVALQQFGFETGSLIAVVGAAGLAIALALQDTLKAVASGVIIAVFRPYRLGDFVRVAGQHGTVCEITPFTTVLNTIDNRRVVVTNDRAWGDTIENFSINRLRQVDEVVSISYDDNIGRAMAIIEAVATTDPRAQASPPFWIKVVQLNTSGVDLRFRVWCLSADFFDFRCDLLRAIKEAFDREGVTIPYPHQVGIMKIEDGRDPTALAAPAGAAIPRDGGPR
jgi:small conductance mechanosensitive channel